MGDRHWFAVHSSRMSMHQSRWRAVEVAQGPSRSWRQRAAKGNAATGGQPQGV